MVFRKMRFRWVQFHRLIFVISGPKFIELFYTMREKSWYKMYLSDFKYLHLFRRYTPSNFEVVRNWVKFCMFLAPEIFFWGGGPSEILDRRYKIRPSSDHRAKFHASQPTHLGDLVLNKK